MDARRGLGPCARLSVRWGLLGVGLLGVGCAAAGGGQRAAGRLRTEGCANDGEPQIGWQGTRVTLRGRAHGQVTGGVDFPSQVRVACRHGDAVYVGVAGGAAAILSIGAADRPGVIGPLADERDVAGFTLRGGILVVWGQGERTLSWYALERAEAPRFLGRLEQAQPGSPDSCPQGEKAVRRVLRLRTGARIAGQTRVFRPGEPVVLCPSARSTLTVPWDEILSAEGEVAPPEGPASDAQDAGLWSPLSWRVNRPAGARAGGEDVSCV